MSDTNLAIQLIMYLSIDDMECLEFDLSSLIEYLGVMVVQNEHDELIPTRVTTGYTLTTTNSSRPQRQTTFPSPSLIKSWRGLPVTHSIVSSMAIRGTTKLRSLLRTKRK